MNAADHAGATAAIAPPPDRDTVDSLDATGSGSSGVPEVPGAAPLTARSVILSVLLGSHPPYLPVRTLVRTTELFGISEGTARTALSRLTSDGDVIASGGMYHLSPRLLQRQWDQDSSLRPRTRSWRGLWEIAVLIPGSGPEKASPAADLTKLRMAELRPGVWVRPDNLIRDWPDAVHERALRFSGRGDLGGRRPADVVAHLWDLRSWTSDADALVAAMDATAELAERFVIAAAMVRHLRSDPILPTQLQPEDWAGGRLRAAYDRYRRELGRLLEKEREREV
jgi:phenylacetic acid degradation operon negative regulatory protein